MIIIALFLLPALIMPVMRFAGFPKLDLRDFRPVSTDRAARAFETGKEDAPLKLR